MMIFLAAALAASAPAEAPITIRASDLNLATAAGQAQLRSRLNAMERKLCTVSSDTGTILGQSDPQCRAQFRASVGAQADAMIAAARGESMAAR